MRAIKIEDIHNEILTCEYLKKNSTECGRDITSTPKVIDYRSTQKILLVTRDPSNEANKLQSVVSHQNSFFRDKILPIIFRDYHKDLGKKDKLYFLEFREKFLELVYWTHYQKCFPGVTSRGHKTPKKVCSQRFLLKEIEAFNPELIVLVGAKAIEFVTGEKDLLVAIEQNGKKKLELNGKQAPVICITHPSGANNGRLADPRYGFIESMTLLQTIISHCYM